MVKKLEKGVGIIVVAVIVEYNILGIIFCKFDNVVSLKDLVGKKYGIWNDLIEFVMLKILVEL